MVLPSLVLERLVFLRRRLDLPDEDSVIERALRIFDRLYCAGLEKSQLLIKNRDGTVDTFHL